MSFASLDRGFENSRFFPGMKILANLAEKQFSGEDTVKPKYLRHKSDSVEYECASTFLLRKIPTGDKEKIL